METPSGRRHFASGMVHPSPLGTEIHCAPLEAGYVKVGVDYINVDFKGITL